MDADDLDPALHGVVRRYSLIVAEERPGDTLSQALGANARHEIAEEQRQREDSWPAWLRSQEQYDDRALLHLEKHKREIAERWKKFNSDHPQLQQGDIFDGGRGPPPLDGLLRAAQDAEAVWEKKKESGIGKTKSAIENFINTMSDHSYLFSIIPSGEKYTSLITGVMTSITKASVNHKKIAELFSRALERITKDLTTVRATVGISDTPKMKLLVVDLYVAVFEFLCDAMDWYGGSSRRRFRVAFRQGYPDDINKITEKVREALDCIRFEAHQATETRIQDTYQDMSGFRQKLDSIYQIVEKLEAAGQKDRENPNASTAAMEQLAEQFKLYLGQNAMRTLVANGEAQQDRRMHLPNVLAIEDRKSPFHRRPSGGDEGVDPVEDFADSPDEMSDTVSSYTRADVQEISAPFLKQYLDDGRSEVLKAGSSISRSVLPSEVAQKVTKWIGHSSSSFLWVEGPVALQAERQLSMIAVLLSDSALSGENPIPCVSFTPRATYYGQQASDAMSRQERVLIALLYSVAGQLIQLLPEELDSPAHTFDTQAFQKLDGSMTSASAALDLIEALLTYGPPTLMVIINRLQVAECPTTRPHLERMVKLLKAYGPEHIIKALFITQGGSPILAGTMDILTEKVNARRMAQAKPGQPLRGWASLGNLKVPQSKTLSEET